MPDPRHDWNEACSEADRLDPGWRWEELLAKRPLLPSDQDAIRVALEAAGKLPADWAADAEDDLHPYTNIPPTREILSYQLPKLRDLVESATSALDVAEPLADLEAGWSSPGQRPVLLHLTAVNHIAGYRKLGHALKFRAFLSGGEGRVDDALADGRRLFGVARAAAEPLMWIGAVMAVSFRFTAIQVMERALAGGEPSEAALVAAQADVESESRFPLLLESTRGERAVQEDLVREVEAGKVTDDQLKDLEILEIRRCTGCRLLDMWIHRLRGGGYDKEAMAGSVRYLTAAIEVLKQSPDAIRNRPEEWEAIRTRMGNKVLRLMPTIDSIIAMDSRQRAWLICMAAAIASERFRQQKGLWPISLNELEGVWDDPYTSKPLLYRSLPDGVVLYSLGPDMKDGGGEVLIGIGPATAGNIGVRLWNPEARRRSG